MKVLLIARSFTKGGAATGAANLASALETQALTLYRRDTDAMPALDIRRPLRTLERIAERALYDAETHCLRLGPPAIDLLAEVRALAPDIVQLCDISASTIRPRDILDCPVPVVHRMSDFWPYHGPSHYGQSAGTAPLAAAKLFQFSGFSLPPDLPHTRVAPSEWLAANTLGTPRPVVIRNAVASPPDLAPRDRPRRPIRLGFVSGKIADPRKGFDRIARSLSTLSLPAELHTWGRGTPRDPGLPATHHGTFARASVRKIMAEMDILLCPSRLDNSPNTATEALAHGVPVIGQSGTGLGSYLSDERGALVDFGGPPELVAEAVARLADGFARASGAALDYARMALSPGAIGSQYMALYHRLTTGS